MGALAIHWLEEEDVEGFWMRGQKGPSKKDFGEIEVV